MYAYMIYYVSVYVCVRVCGRVIRTRRKGMC
jgi:hypothetical protein